ncbi:MAG: UDP-N-acetylglucosamine diphosphorylase [Puniceicoccaceae bacterium]|nr:UDP-N-acetylglucosamine diphosphorylase [Puniceicoccaceae bacterium]RCL30121.1 MAG: UDP-N-acetylglucosamine diphosphorylase [Puniceicoccaceae bacterium]|tara:strand:+ start:893 stop:1594 length:702 start_codon:yes stop_codon:yes gene_type:complete
MLKAEDFFTLSESFIFKDDFSLSDSPWLWVQGIKKAATRLDSEAFKLSESKSDIPPNLHIEGSVFIHPTVNLPPFGSISGPCYIGKHSVLRPGVFIRGNVIVGESCLLGNSCEFKNALILDGAQIPHFSYVGDSVIGQAAHLGAGVICSNLRLDQKPVKVCDLGGKRFDTGMRKLGAIIGDRVEIGCNTVLNPGSLLLAESMVYPNLTFSGTLNSGQVAYQEKGLKSVRFKSK